jgi:predicted lipoprotein with Yx(FWY)xxD motif
MRRPWIAAVAAAAVALIAAGCGGSSKSSSTSSQSTASGSAAVQSQSSGTGSQGGGYGGYGGRSKTTPGTQSGSSAAIATRKLAVGTALVGAGGRTLYLFEKDKGAASTCSGACAQAWPPLTASSMPKAGAGVDASKLTLIKRSDGTRQVAYAGHPLYYFVKDKKAGQDAGQDVTAFGAGWYVVAPSGQKIDEG